MKRTALLILAAVILCSCAKNGDNGETAPSASETAEISSAETASVTTAEEQTAASVTEEKPAEPAKQTEEGDVITFGKGDQTASISPELYSEKTADHIGRFSRNTKFTETLEKAEGVQIIDLDLDGTPEMIFKIAGTDSCNIFSLNERGKGKWVSPDGGKYSFDGGFLTPYRCGEEIVFLTEYFSGTSTSGKGGISRVSFDGEKASSEIIESYKFGRNSALEYDFEYEHGELVSSLEPGWVNSAEDCKIIGGGDLDSNLRRLCYLLDDYFDREEKLAFFNEDIPYRVEYLPVKEYSYSYGCETNVNSYEYDLAGNMTSADISFWIYGAEYPSEGKYFYNYSPDGTYDSVIYYGKNGGVLSTSASVSELSKGNVLEEFDEQGRLIRETYYYRGSADEILRTVDYFYGADGQLERSVTQWNFDCVYTYYYENGRISRKYVSKVGGEERLFEEYSYDGTKTVVTTYNSLGHPALVTTYDYDSRGNLIYEDHDITDYYREEPDESDRTIVYTYRYKYDDENRLTEEIYDYGLTVTTEYFYNEYGDLSKIVETVEGDYDDEMNGICRGVYTTLYEYDRSITGEKLCMREYYDGKLSHMTEYAPVRVLETKVNCN